MVISLPIDIALSVAKPTALLISKPITALIKWEYGQLVRSSTSIKQAKKF